MLQLRGDRAERLTGPPESVPEQTGYERNHGEQNDSQGNAHGEKRVRESPGQIGKVEDAHEPTDQHAPGKGEKQGAGADDQDVHGGESTLRSARQMDDPRDDDGVENDLSVKEILRGLVAREVRVPERPGREPSGQNKHHDREERVDPRGIEPLDDRRNENASHERQTPDVEPPQEIGAQKLLLRRSRRLRQDGRL